MFISAKNNIAISQTNPAQQKQIIARFLLMFWAGLGCSFLGSEIKVSILSP